MDDTTFVMYNFYSTSWPELYGPFDDDREAERWIEKKQGEGWDGLFYVIPATKGK